MQEMGLQMGGEVGVDSRNWEVAIMWKEISRNAEAKFVFIFYFVLEEIEFEFW